jgi:tetratricopeptide (TPR) repeat protein
LFSAAPWVLLAFGSIALFRRWPTPIRVTTGACAWLVVANASVLTLFFGTCSRYEIAFAPYLTLIAAWVVLTAEQQCGGWSRARTAAMRLCWLGALVVSIGFGLLFAVRTRGDSYVKLGYRYALADQWDPAAAEFSRALRFDPDNLTALKLRAHCEISSSRNREAMADLRTVVARDPADARAWNQLGVLASREPGRETEAVEFFERCVKLTPRDAEAHCNVGIALLRANVRQDEAIRELRYALRLNPGLEPARRALLVAGAVPTTDN